MLEQSEILEKLTTEHELYLSVGLKTHAAMKPSTFKDLIDNLLFENIGYMQSWGTHTKGEYIGIIDEQFKELKQYREAIKKINEIVTRKYIMSGRLAEIHDVIESLPQAIGTTALLSEAEAESGQEDTP